MKLIEVYSKVTESIKEDRRGKYDWSEDEATSIIEKFRKKLKEKGISPTSVIGTGTRGIAYSSGGKVFKITSDQEEAVAAKSLIGKKLHNVYTVYAVFQFDGTGYYGIFQEKLKKMDFSGPEGFFQEVLDDTEIPSLIAQYRNDKFDFETLKEEVMAELGSYAGRHDMPEDYINVAEKGLFDVLNGIQELRDNGIKYSDVFSGNIMKRKNGNYVIIDIGYSESRPLPIEEI